LGTYVFLEHTLRAIGAEAAGLRNATASDRARRGEVVPLSWRVPDGPPAEEIDFLGIASRDTLSAISGGVRTEWLGEPKSGRVPLRRDSDVATSVTRPRAYWIPAAWRDVIAKLDLHGIPYERLTAS